MSEILRFDKLKYRYPGSDSYALDGASLAIKKGSRVALMGSNGAGKSTLMLHANGILQPESGDVFVEEQALTYDRKSLQAVRQKIGLIFQNPDDQLFSASVMQDISFGPINMGCSQDEAHQRVHEAAELCDVEHLLDRPTHALSGGEKTRVALAGVLAMKPLILLADEVTAALDHVMRRQIFQVFKRLYQQGMTLVLSTHDIRVAQHWADYIVWMHEGSVLAADTPSTFFSNDDLMTKIGLNRMWYSDLA